MEVEADEVFSEGRDAGEDMICPVEVADGLRKRELGGVRVFGVGCFEETYGSEGADLFDKTKLVVVEGGFAFEDLPGTVPSFVVGITAFDENFVFDDKVENHPFATGFEHPLFLKGEPDGP